MGNRKVLNFEELEKKKKKCPRVKARCLRTDVHQKYTRGRDYDIENNRQHDYLILNDEGILKAVSKTDFELLNNGMPVNEDKKDDKKDDENIDNKKSVIFRI